MSASHAAQLAFAAWAALLLAMGGIGFVLYGRLLRGLRERHPAEWERLGRPGVIYYASQGDRRALGRWISHGGFEQLGDPDFAGSCRRYRAYLRAYGWAFAALWLLFGAVLALRA